MKKKGILKNAKHDSTPTKGNVIFDEANLDANLAERPEGGYMSIDEPKVTRRRAGGRIGASFVLFLLFPLIVSRSRRRTTRAKERTR